MSLADNLLTDAVLRTAVARVSAGCRDSDSRAVLLNDASSVVRELRTALAAGQTSFGTARRKLVQLDKLRSLVELHPLDRVVHSALASQLASGLEPQFSSGLLSYRKGFSRELAVSVLRKLAAQNRHANPQPRDRGLWVVRLDVQSYGDSIAINDESELWTQLTSALPEEPTWFHTLLRAAIQCGAMDDFKTHGLPSGSPICNPLLNLYLSDFDRALEPRCAAYLRYGDDIVLITESAGGANQALAMAEQLAARKELVFGAAKLQRLYWNGSGRTPDQPGWRGTRTVPFVGLEIGYLNATRIKTVKRRELLTLLRACLTSAAALLNAKVLSDRTKALCHAAHELLSFTSPLALPQLAAFLQTTSCRTQLAQMDDQIAMMLVQLITGARGRRGFRKVTWRELHQAGLPSLTALRNHGRRSSVVADE